MTRHITSAKAALLDSSKAALSAALLLPRLREVVEGGLRRQGTVWMSTRRGEGDAAKALSPMILQATVSATPLLLKHHFAEQRSTLGLQ